MPVRRVVAIVASFLSLLAARPSLANDAAAETAAGGIQLRDERRIAMVKERLSIGKRFLKRVRSRMPNLEYQYRVTVDYEFLNESPSNVTTEVAFPLPEYDYPGEDLVQDRRIRGFKLEVDGRDTSFNTEVRARVGGRDVTEALRRFGIDIESFGGFDHNPQGPHRDQFDELSKGQLKQLRAMGAIAPVGGDDWPRWSIAVTHHWTQTFPAGKVVRVRHEYDAIPGFSYSGDVREYLSKQLRDGCFEEPLKERLEAEQARRRAGDPGKWTPVQAEWVRYILTTANTWKTPIRDFELVLERPKGEYISFCWPGKVERLDSERYRATAKDFVPARELLVYFLSVN